MKKEEISESFDEVDFREPLKKFSDLDLAAHYNFEESVVCKIKNPQEAILVITEQRPITFVIDSENVLYYKLGNGDKEEQLDIDVEKSFFHKKKSNVKISTRSRRFSKPPEVSTDFFHEFNELFKNFDLDKHVIDDGCFETNKHTLQDQINCKNFTGSVAPDRESLKINSKELIPYKIIVGVSDFDIKFKIF